MLLSLLALSMIACGYKTGFQKGELSDIRRENEERERVLDDPPPPMPEERATIPEPPPTERSTFTPPDEGSVARAREANLPDIKEGLGVAGPFVGPLAALVYLTAQGHLTLFDPLSHSGFFGVEDGPSIQWTYMVSTRGYARFDDRGKAVALQHPPEGLRAWPLSVPVATEIASHTERMIERDTTDALYLRRREQLWFMAQSLDLVAEGSSTSVTSRIDAKGCELRRVATTYVGCW